MRPTIVRMGALVAFLMGCAGDPAIDAQSEQALNEAVVPAVVWRAADACGESLPAGGSARPVEGERGLRAWVGVHGRALCVDSAARFLGESGAELESDPGADPRADVEAPLDAAWAHADEPDPQPMIPESRP